MLDDAFTKTNIIKCIFSTAFGTLRASICHRKCYFKSRLQLDTSLQQAASSRWMDGTAGKTPAVLCFLPLAPHGGVANPPAEQPAHTVTPTPPVRPKPPALQPNTGRCTARRSGVKPAGLHRNTAEHTQVSLQNKTWPNVAATFFFCFFFVFFVRSSFHKLLRKLEKYLNIETKVYIECIIYTFATWAHRMIWCSPCSIITQTY